MKRRVAAVLIVSLIALGGLAAVLLLLRDRDGGDPALAALSTRGRPIEMAVPERLGPWAKLTGEAILITEYGGLRFLRLPRNDGSSCWATGERRSGLWQLTNYGCETGFFRFPDAKRPVMVVGRMQVIPGTQLMAYEAFAGFAADAVKRIAIVDPQDRIVPVAEVVRNVFRAATPPGRAKAVAALDETGEVIWRGPGVQLPDE